MKTNLENLEKLMELAKSAQELSSWSVLDVFDIPNAANMTTEELLAEIRPFEPCLDVFAAEDEQTPLEWLESQLKAGWYTVNEYGVVSWVDGCRGIFDN